jgi:hypothetical protein
MDSFLNGLAEEGAKVVLELVLFAVLFGVAALFARNWARRGKVWVTGDAGHTRMSPVILLLGLLCGAVAAAVLVLGLVFRESLREPGDFYAWLGLIGGFLFFFVLMLPFTRQTWDWDREGLRWQGAWRGISMRWSELARAGKSWDGQFYVADKTGRKIKWSPQYTLEPEALRRAIETARPDLSLPEG